MILFETDKKPLTYLLDQIENRDVALPGLPAEIRLGCECDPGIWLYQ
jgi:hypothetical protein